MPQKILSGPVLSTTEYILSSWCYSSPSLNEIEMYNKKKASFWTLRIFPRIVATRPRYSSLFTTRFSTRLIHNGVTGKDDNCLSYTVYHLKPAYNYTIPLNTSSFPHTFNLKITHPFIKNIPISN